MCLSDKILGDVEVAITTSVVKRCITTNILARWVTADQSAGEVMDDVELTITTGEVKWSTFIVVPGVWVTAAAFSEVSHQIQVTIIGGVVQRNVSLAVFDSITVTGNKTLDKILPAPVSSKMKQRDLSYQLFAIQK